MPGRGPSRDASHACTWPTVLRTSLAFSNHAHISLIGSASSAATRNMNAKANSTTQHSVQHAARTPGSKLMQRCFILTSSSSSSLLLSPTPPNERCQFARQWQHPIDSVAFLPDFRLAPSERNDRLNSSQTALSPDD
ncbi:hypothetical protein CSPX01_10908 [Colletotrichum filicis]|nr:hypothetical protein CSPX01_10908 [Colletotrichum filicis]